MRRLMVATLAVALVTATAACGGGSGDDGSSGGTLTIASIATAQPWDLKDAGLGNNAQYYQPVYDSLLRLDPDANPVPNLATEWSYDDTNTVLTLTLRDDVSFTDGTAFDAEAVKVNLLHTQTGTNEAAGQLTAITDVTAVDSTTVDISLSAPDPSLVANLGSVAGMMASPPAIESGELENGPVGSGPYTLDASTTTAGSVYTYARNDDYWNPDDFPYDTIVIKTMTDPTAILNALRSGQINGASITSVKNIAPAQNSDLNVNILNPGDIEGLYIWDRAGTIVPALGDVRVRKALNYAFDRDAIVETARLGLGTPTTQVFNPEGEGYDSELDSAYSYDPEKAKELLAEAGYPNGFEVTMPDFSSFFPDQQAVITEYLGAIGITVNYETVAADQLINVLLSGKYAMTYMTLASFRPWDTIVLEIREAALWNMLHYTDSTMADLITRAQNATGEEQVALYKEINAYTVEQAWNVPWDSIQTAYVTTKDVEVVHQAFACVPPIYNYSPAS